MFKSLCAFAVLAASAALALFTPDSATPVRAADPAPAAGLAGNWKLTLPVRGGEIIILISLAEKDGKWTAGVPGTSRDLGAALSVRNLSVNGDVVKFSLFAQEPKPKDEPKGKEPPKGKEDPKGKEEPKVKEEPKGKAEPKGKEEPKAKKPVDEGEEVLTFEGVLSKDKKKLNGTLASGGRPQLTTLMPSKLSKLDDPLALARETLSQVEDGPLMFELAMTILGAAGEMKLPVADARGIVDRVNKVAAEYGPRWERDVALRLVDTLSNQDGLSELAVGQAKRAEKLLGEDEPASTRMAVLEAIIRTLTKSGKLDETKPYVERLAKLELRDFAEYAKTHPPFKPEPFAGRKAKSDRAAVVEVFTGAECPPCVGVDLAYDGLLKAYKPTEAILLQYHLHVPRPDPLTSPAANDRANYYGDTIQGTPTLFINGKVAADSGGGAPAAEKFYKQFRATVEEALEKPAGAKIALAVTKGEKGGYSAKATVSDLAMPGQKVMLRFALVEDRVRYAGGNGLRYHHMVVRAMPGGEKGFPLTKKSQEQTVAIDPEEVRTTLAKYLDDFAKMQGPFPRADRPLALRDLKLVALVQDDATKEILNAVQVDLEGK